MHTLTAECSTLLLGLCATHGIAVCEDKAGNQEHGGEDLFYSGATASEDNSKFS